MDKATRVHRCPPVLILSGMGCVTAGVVTLLGVWVSDGVSRCGGAGFRAGAQAVAGRSVTPVICSRMVKRRVISAR